jgi:MFS family permease
MGESVAERTTQREGVTEHTRWNFAVIVAEATFFMAGLAWVDPSSVLPMFIGTLTPSTVVIGVITVLQRLGWLLPPIFMAAVLGHRPRRLPWLRWPVLLGRLPFLVFVGYLWLCGLGSPRAVIWLLVIAYSGISLGNGLLGISWQDIIAKSIPSRLRGRFFGTMQFATAGAAFGVGLVVRWMLGPGGPGLPLGYTILFTAMAVFLTASIVGCWMVREPIRPVLDRPQSVREILLGALPLLRERRAFRALVFTASLGFGISFSLPFYMVYARQVLHVPEEIAGVYIWAMTIGGALSSILWGYLNDRRGPRAVLRGGGALVTVTPTLAICVPAIALALRGLLPGLADALPYLFAVVFFAGGSTMGAMWMGSMNYLFELTSHQDRPRYIALFNLFTVPGAFVPLLIGLLLNYLPFSAVFSLMVACGGAALLLSCRLPHPTPLDSSTARE